MPNPAIFPISTHTLASAWHQRRTCSRIKSQMRLYPAVLAKSYEAAIVSSSFVSRSYGLAIAFASSYDLAVVFTRLYNLCLQMLSQARTLRPCRCIRKIVRSWLIDVFGIEITNSVDTISIARGRHRCHGQNSPPANENFIFFNRSWLGIEMSD